MMMTRELLMAIDAERERRGLSKNELAELAGIHPQQVRRLFTSERANPTMKTLLTILAALRIGWTFTLPEAANGVGAGTAAATYDGDLTIAKEADPEAAAKGRRPSGHGRKRDAA